MAEMTYDGFGRQQRWMFPSKATPGVADQSDYEQYLYDADGNRVKLRKRDGLELTYQYEALNRMTVKIVPERAGLTPGQTMDVYYDYDLRGLQTKARFGSLSGEGVTTDYDGFGRVSSSTITMLGFSRTLSYLYDAGGKRVRITHPDGKSFSYVYDGLDRMTYVHDKASITGPDDYVARYFYRPEGPRYVAIRGVGPSGFTTVYHYDPVQRLALMGNDLAGTAADMTVTLAYNPAGQIRQYDRDNNAFAWTGSKSVNRDYATNGQNQYSSAGEATFAYDRNGNLISTRNDPWSTDYVYDVENRLVSATGTNNAFLVYDPLGRLAWFSGPNTGMTQLLYDGDDLVAEYDGAGTLTRRYVHGSETDDPVAVYEGASLGFAGRRYMLPDERGSIAALVNADGTPFAINSYDEYGIPGASNQGRFQYTGQAWIAELGLYYYKARFYSPYTGRFLQMDPIGYEDQINLYAYVGNDPVNKRDSTGLAEDDPYRFSLGGFTLSASSKGVSVGLSGIGSKVSLSVGSTGVSASARLGSSSAALTAGKAGVTASASSSGATAGITTNRSGVSGSVSVAQAGAALAVQIGANRVSVMTPSGRMSIDLAGKAHYDKASGSSIPTPHVKFQRLNTNPESGRTNLSPGTTRPATMADVRTARAIIERRAEP